MQIKTERWVFTEKELAAPSVNGCKSHDMFIATGLGLPEEGVFVYRNGVVSNYYGDGIVGVTQEHKDLAEAVETLYDQDSGDMADTWRDVCTNNGMFVDFKKEEPVNKK